jgi:hypothetical protein
MLLNFLDRTPKRTDRRAIELFITLNTCLIRFKNKPLNLYFTENSRLLCNNASFFYSTNKVLHKKQKSSTYIFTSGVMEIQNNSIQAPIKQFPN